MSKINDIRDDEIRVISSSGSPKSSRPFPWWWLLAGALLIAAALFFAFPRKAAPESEEAVFEQVPIQAPDPKPQLLSRADAASDASYTEIIDSTVNDIPLRLFIPHNAQMSLQLGRPDRSDSSIIYIAQAADVRADNGGIVGAFVLKGQPKAWGLSKRGYCASIGGEVYVGVADNSPLFEQATESEGYFFRQYPLVCDGKVVDNEPKGKSIRRAICERYGEIFMVESLTPESFHDFAQALADLSTQQAVYLVGSNAYGWAVDAAGNTHEFGDENIYRNWRRRMPANTSYLVWRKQ